MKNRWTALVALTLAGAAASAYWIFSPLPLAGAGTAALDLHIAARTPVHQIALQIHEAGVRSPAWLLFGFLRLSGQARQIQAGSYEISPGMTPLDLLGKLVRGEQALRRVTLVEGWNYRQVLQALRSADQLSWDLPDAALDHPQLLMRALGQPGRHPEGRFFPDTYLYPKREKASVLLRRAEAAMQRQLEQAWSQRAPGLPLRTPEEALILASVVEKETGSPADREHIAAVFINRLRLGMRLQTDPTVIYGLGPHFDGNLRKHHLQTDTPYNTYTRSGLPPTPISIPGLAALRAALKPANSTALYFVARGDGSSQFSQTLEEHNRAVRRYILPR